MTEAGVRTRRWRPAVCVLHNVLMAGLVLLVVYLTGLAAPRHGVAHFQLAANTDVDDPSANIIWVGGDHAVTVADWTDRQVTSDSALPSRHDEHAHKTAQTGSQDIKRKRRIETGSGKRQYPAQFLTVIGMLTTTSMTAHRQRNDDDNTVRKKTSRAGNTAKKSFINTIKPWKVRTPRRQFNTAHHTEVAATENVTSFLHLAVAIDADDRTTAAAGVTESTTSSGETDQRRTSPGNTTRGAGDETLWSLWGRCSITCGVGQQERTRSCGPHCQEIESKPCLLEPCAGDDDTWLDKWAYFEMLDLTSDVDLDTGTSDPCERWMKCSNQSIQHYLSKVAQLPSCPCHYPLRLAVTDRLYDADYDRDFAWEDASDVSERNDVYRPGATYCIRSLLPEHSFSLAAQYCCYDSHQRLITRGRDAGTPNLVSPQISRELHKKVDLLPWVICKGDWTRYDLVLHPNNKRQCVENPSLDVIHEQIRLAKMY